MSWRDTSLLSTWVSKCLLSFLAGGAVVVVQSSSIGVWVLDPPARTLPGRDTFPGALVGAGLTWAIPVGHTL